MGLKTTGRYMSQDQFSNKIMTPADPNISTNNIQTKSEQYPPPSPGGYRCEVHLLQPIRALDKREYLMIIFLIPHQNHML